MVMYKWMKNLTIAQTSDKSSSILLTDTSHSNQ